MKQKNHNMNAEYKILRGQVVWAITHYGLVPSKGVFEHLRNTLDKIDLKLEEIKLSTSDNKVVEAQPSRDAMTFVKEAIEDIEETLGDELPRENILGNLNAAIEKLTAMQ